MEDKNTQHYPSAVLEGASLEATPETHITTKPAVDTGAIPISQTTVAQTPYAEPASAHDQKYTLKVYKSDSKLKTYLAVITLILILIGAGVFIYIANKNDLKLSFPSQPLQVSLNNEDSGKSELEALTLSVGTNLIVRGTSNLQGDVAFDGNLNVVQNLTVQGKTQLNFLEVNGSANINGELRVNGQLIPPGSFNVASGNTTIINNIVGESDGGNGGQLAGDGSGITNIKAINCADCVRLQGSNATDQVGDIALAGEVRARKMNLRAAINAVDTFTVESATGEKIISADTLNKNVVVENLRPNTQGTVTGGTYTAEYDQYNGETHLAVSNVAVGDVSSVLGHDDKLRLVYQDANTSDIVYVRCLDIQCTTSTQRIVGSDPVNWTRSPSISLDATGLPYISYVNDSTFDITFLHCNNDDCTSPSSRVFPGNASDYPIVHVINGIDGYPRLIIGKGIYDSLNDSSIYRLDFIRCTNMTCSTFVQTEVVNEVDNFYAADVEATATGEVKILAYANNNDETLLLTCSDNDCSTHTSAALGENWPIDLYIDTNNLPRVLQQHYDGITNSQSIQLISCSDVQCSSHQSTTIKQVSSSNNEDQNVNGYGVYELSGSVLVAYNQDSYNYTTHESTSMLRFATCQNSSCISVIDRPAATDEDSNPYQVDEGPDSQLAAIYSVYDVNSGTESIHVRTHMTPATYFAEVTVPAQHINGTSVGDSAHRFGQLYSQNINVQTASTDTALLINKVGITGYLSDGTFLNQITGDLVDMQINGTSVFNIDAEATFTLSDPSTANTYMQIQPGSFSFKNADETDLFSVTQQSAVLNTSLIVSPPEGSLSDKFIVGDMSGPSLRVNADGGLLVGQAFSDVNNFYEVVNDTYTPATLSSNATNVSLTDDSVSDPIDLPFSVNFYNQRYDNIRIISDGGVTFNDYYCLTRYNPFYARDLGCKSVVLGGASDLDPGAGGVIRYEILGDAPNRVFVAEFTNVREYGTSSGQMSFQIHVRESANPNVGNSITVYTMDANMESRTYGQGLVSPDGNNMTYVDERINMPASLKLTGDAITYSPSRRFNELSNGNVSIEKGLSVQGSVTANQAILNTIIAPSVKTNKFGTTTEGLNMSWYNSDSTNFRTVGNGTLAEQSVDTNPFLIDVNEFINWPTGVNMTYTNARWTGWFKASYTGPNNFQTCSNGGSRLSIEDNVVVDKWVDGGSYCKTGTVYLEESTWYPIQIDYYHGTESNASISVTMSTKKPPSYRPLNYDHGIDNSSLSTMTSATEPGGMRADGSLLQIVGDVGFTGKIQDSDATGSYLRLNGADQNSGAALITTRTADNVGLMVQGSGSQTGDLLQLKNASGTVLTSFDADGNLNSNASVFIKPSVNTSTAFRVQNATNTSLFTVNTLDLRVEIGGGTDLHLAGSGNTRNAITKTYGCSAAEGVYDVVIINGIATVGRTTTAGSNRVAGVVVAKPDTNTCTVAIGGVAQVNFGTNANPTNIGDPVTTSAVAGMAHSDAAPPVGSVVGNSTSPKDGSNLVWILIRGQ